MEQSIIATAQDDVGSPFRLDTSDVAFVSSWTRPSNDVMETEVDRLVPVENMSTSQVLRAGYRSDLPNGQTRLCLSYLIAGLFLSSFVSTRKDFLCNIAAAGPLPSDDSINNRNDDLIAPLIVDLIPAMDRRQGSTEEDFCEDNGSVSIHPVLPLVMKRVSYILRNYSKIFSEGNDVWDAFLRCVFEEGHTVKVLSDVDIAALDVHYDDLRQKSLSNVNMLKAILIKHKESSRTSVLFNCMQISSTIGGVSTNERF